MPRFRLLPVVIVFALLLSSATTVTPNAFGVSGHNYVYRSVRYSLATNTFPTKNDVSDVTDQGSASIAPSMQSVTTIAAGEYHTCVLTSMGGVKCWGDNRSGQLGDGTTTHRLTPVDVIGLTSGVVAIAAGLSRTCALTSAGGVKCWGRNSYGQLGDGTVTNRLTPVNVSGLTSGVMAIAAGAYHTCVLTSVGGVKCWGWNIRGQLGDGTTTQRLTPVNASGLTNGVMAIAAGAYHTCVLMSAGGVKCWGWNSNGQLGDGTTTQRLTPVNVSGLTNGATAIATRLNHTCALTSAGGVKCWGWNLYGQLGDGTTTQRLTSVDVNGLTSEVKAIATGDLHTCALTSTGGVKCWGLNVVGELGDGTTTQRLIPVDVSGLTNGVVAIVAGNTHTCALTSTGSVKCWGYKGWGQLGDGTSGIQVTPITVNGLTSGIAAILAGRNHSCALTGAGSVKCWGSNTSGELGDGTTAERLTPVDVNGLTSEVIAIAAGDGHTCVLTNVGGVKCWGWNDSGELGDGTTTNRLTPVDVGGLTSGVMAIAAGNIHTCALTSMGGVKCWGWNGDGQLGDGTTTERHTPVDVNGLRSGVMAITAGAYHTCALTSVGSVKCWGNNDGGQLGDGTTLNHLTPVEVSGLTNGVVAIAVGNYHTCALMSTGGIKCWGGNGAGELGDGTTTQRLTPVNVSGLTSGVIAIAARYYHTCALPSMGSVKCWGWNGYGELGDGTTTQRLTPVNVSGLTSGVMAIAAGDALTCALTSMGGVKCWGDNRYGQLGYGIPAYRTTPADVKWLPDSDGDCLPDDWEINGYDANGDGIVDVNLRAMGANPLRKDIFVEVDYMVDYGTCSAGHCVPGHSHRPSPVAIARVVGAFANAPVSNPDGSTGITLHVDISEELPHQNTLKPGNGQWSLAAGGDWSEVDRIKNDQGHFDSRRAKIFHYVIFAHELGGMCGSQPCGTTSGISRNDDHEDVNFRQGASDFVISLGGWINSIGTTPEQAGTFMHELGHNLGLRHGGDDHQNFEPNYLSVMNYSFQMSGLILNTNDGLLDYSRFGNIPPLNEAHITETVGLSGGSAIAGYGTRYYCRPASEWRDNQVTNANGSIDWNCSGNAGGTDVQANINDGNRDALDSTISILTSFDDWPALVYDGGSIGPDTNSLPLVLTSLNDQSVSMDELTYEIDSQLYRPYKIALLGADDIVASLGTTFTKVVTVRNLGALTATISISSTSSSGWFNLSSIPLSVTLTPRASFPIPITATVPALLTGAIANSVTITATIQESPLMGDSVAQSVRIGPMAQFEAEPVYGTLPHTVTFTDYSVGQITGWSWDFGDGATSTLPSPSHIYTRAGVYTPTLTVTGPSGSDTVTKATLITVLHKVYLPLILLH